MGRGFTLRFKPTAEVEYKRLYRREFYDKSGCLRSVGILFQTWDPAAQKALWRKLVRIQLTRSEFNEYGLNREGWPTTTCSECCSACGNKYSEVWLTGVNFNYTMKHIFHWLTCLTASSSGRQWWFTVVWTVCPLNASLNYLFRSHANHRWYSSRSAILVIYSLCPQSLQ